VIIAQITDLHARPPGVRAYAGIDTNAMMRSAVAAIGRLDPLPDCVIATGDLTDCGLAEEYGEVADALANLPMPAFLIPGNHDRRDVMRACLGDRHPYLTQDPDFLHYVIDEFPVRLIALDTVVGGETGGTICAAREAWLARVLAQGDGRSTLIFMHHPPFRTGLPAMDTMLCTTSPTFAELIARHPEVERIVAGHCHRPIVVRFAGTVGFVAPSTAHQVVLDFRSDDDNRFIHEPPGLALHVHEPGLGIVSHVAVVGDYGPIHSFSPPPEYPGRQGPADRRNA
jgi:3',5'-cyclic AMP phosphodiesterase CpdA